MAQAPLPIDALLPRIVETLSAAGTLVLVAPPGAGKTTRVPPALLDAGLAGDGAVIVLEPRRLAARAAARRMASERGGAVGGEVGYHVRFERQAGPRTRLLLLTEGIFLRRLQDDPLLSGVGAVVFDEYHERGLDADLCLAMVRRVREQVRPELPVLIMSATLDGEALAAALGCPLLAAEGRSFPVEVAFAPGALPGKLADHVRLGVADALRRTAGDVLVFLPGVGEIRGAATALAELAAAEGVDLVELFGDLPPEQQDRALLAGPRRKVVLSTNVAETSVTIEGITAVVDSGLARVLRFDPDRGLDHLEVAPISRASAEQRAGRAGRVAPGRCLRLYTRGEFDSRPERDLPEIRRADLSALVLQLLAWGEVDPLALPWLERPEPAALASAGQLLRCLGALRDGRLTPLGKDLARLPVSPRLGRLLLAGRELGCAWEAALAAALLSERDPFERRPQALAASRCDVSERVAALLSFSGGGGRAPRDGDLRAGAARAVVQVAEQLADLAGVPRSARRPGATELANTLPRALLAAFPDRVARRREPGSARLVLVGGSGALLAESSSVRDGELLLCVSLQGSRKGEPLVRLASRLEREWLDPALLSERRELHFDRSRETVAARRLQLFDDLVLQDDSTGELDAGGAAAVLAQAAAADPERALALDAPELQEFVARLRWLGALRADLELPRFERADLVRLLPDLCRGLRSFAELRALSLAEALAARLAPAQRTALASLAPERIELPSGRRAALRYAEGRAPVLAVAMQEFFGQRETPRVGGGQVKVVLELLAPSGRPQQVTDDLPSFWAKTWPALRRELGRRYPRHAWPEDPLTARPESRPPRGSRRR